MIIDYSGYFGSFGLLSGLFNALITTQATAPSMGKPIKTINVIAQKGFCAKNSPKLSGMTQNISF